MVLRSRSRFLQHLFVVARHALGRDARDGRDHRLDFFRGDGLAALVLGQQHLRRADLVDHVDRLVGQLAVADIARRQFDRGADRLGRVAHLVMPLVVRLQPAQDLHRILDRRLVDVDLLETADQRAVLLEVVAIFFISRRADAADIASGKRRLQQVRRIHRAARGGAGADHRVDLVDEQHRARRRLELGEHGLEPLFEIAAIARAGEERAHIEREDRGVLQHFRDFALHDAAREAFGDRGLADARIADIERIVLLAAAEDLDRAVDLMLAADQRIDLAVRAPSC